MKADFDAVFSEQYAGLVSRTDRILPPGLGDAEEFVHQAYLRCRQSWSSDASSSYDRGAYFIRSIRWLVTDALRRRRRETELLRIAAPTRPQSAAKDFSRAEVGDALEAMPRRQRELGNALLAGKTAEEIERQFGLSNAARAVGMSRLRKEWTKRLK